MKTTIPCETCGGAGSKPSPSELRRIFRSLGLSQSDTARRLKISPQYFNDILRGRRAATHRLATAMKRLG